MKIYVFGNDLVKEDSGALLLVSKLRLTYPHVQFLVVDPNENFPPQNEKNIVVLDTVEKIHKPILLDFSDLAAVNKTPVSPHDYDLLLHLLLLKKMGKIDSVKIIGVPTTQVLGSTLKEVKQIISSLLSKNAMHRTCTDQKRG